MRLRLRLSIQNMRNLIDKATMQVALVTVKYATFHRGETHYFHTQQVSHSDDQ